MKHAKKRIAKIEDWKTLKICENKKDIEFKKDEKSNDSHLKDQKTSQIFINVQKTSLPLEFQLLHSIDDEIEKQMEQENVKKMLTKHLKDKMVNIPLQPMGFFGNTKMSAYRPIHSAQHGKFDLATTKKLSKRNMEKVKVSNNNLQWDTEFFSL